MQMPSVVKPSTPHLYQLGLLKVFKPQAEGLEHQLAGLWAATR